jgi:hypothetical protein
LYNIALSLLGSGAVFAVTLANGEPDADLSIVIARSLRIAVSMAAILIATAGQGLAVLAMRVFHGRELPYYRNGGMGEGMLAVGSWAVALVAGALLYIAGSLWA